MVKRACALLLALAAPHAVAGHVFDETALLQVAHDFDYDSDRAQAVAALTHELGLEVDEDRPSPAMIKASLDSAVSIYERKVAEDKDIMVEITQKLVSAFIEEAQRHLKSGIPILGDVPAKVTSYIAQKKKELSEISHGLSTGQYSRQLQDWVGKLANTSAEMAKHFLDKNQDWQNLAAGSLMLQSQKNGINRPDAHMIVNSINEALNVLHKKRAEDDVVMSNISKTLSKAWQNELKRVASEVRSMTIAQSEEIFGHAKEDSKDAIMNVVMSIANWVGENIKDGKLTDNFVKYIKNMTKQSGSSAMDWFNTTMAIQKMASGAFMRQTNEVETLSSEAVGNLSRTVARRMVDMKKLQGEVVNASNDIREWSDWLTETTQKVKKGSRDMETLGGLKTSMDETGLFAGMWSNMASDIMQITANYFQLAAQTTPISEEVKAEFDRVMLEQERLVSGKGEGERKSLFESGEMKPESFSRVEAIMDDTADMARHWIGENLGFQELTGDVLDSIVKAAKED